MYNIVRKIHLYSGLVILAFLMMYFVSGYMMIHRPWFLGPPSTTTQTVTLDSIGALPIEQLAVEAKKRLELGGRTFFAPIQPPDMKRFFVIRPGTTVRVDVPAGGDVVHVITQRYGVVGTLIVLHKVRGYDDQWLFNAYALFCDLSGLSMIVFAISGVYLWWKRTKNRVWGVLCLSGSCVYAAGMMVYFAYAR
jgi:hypothetical protein